MKFNSPHKQTKKTVSSASEEAQRNYPFIYDFLTVGLFATIFVNSPLYLIFGPLYTYIYYHYLRKRDPPWDGVMIRGKVYYLNQAYLWAFIFSATFWFCVIALRYNYFKFINDLDNLDWISYTVGHAIWG